MVSRVGKNGMRRSIPEYWFYVGLVLVAILSLFDFTILGHDFGTDAWKSQYPWANEYPTKSVTTVSYDSILEHKPWLDFARDEMLSGRIPLWNPYSFTGTPLYANHLIPVTYPPLTVSLLLFDSSRVAGWAGVIHLAIFGIGLFRLFRRLGIDPWPAFIVAAASLFTGACFALWYAWAAAVVWMPWVIAEYEGFHNSRNIRHLAYAGLSLGLMLMAGFPPIVVQFIYFFLVYILLREFFSSTGKFRSILITVSVTFVVGGLLSGVQNVPTAVHSRDTYRSVKYAHSSAYLDPPPPPEEMLLELADIPPKERSIIGVSRFIAPVYRIRIYSNRNFIGAFLFFLCVTGFLLMPANRRIWIWLALIYLVISYYNPLYNLLWKYLPLWKMRVYEPREIWQLCVLVSAAFGLNALFRGELSNCKAIGKIILTISGIAIAGLLFISSSINIRAVSDLLPAAESGAEISGYAYSITFLLFAIFILSRLWRPSPMRGVGTALILILIFAGGIAGRTLALPYSSKTKPFTPDQSEFIREITRMCGQDGRIVRITSRKYYGNFRKRDKVPFLANLGMLYRIRDVSGYDSLVTKRTVDYLNMIEAHSLSMLRIHMSFTDPDVMNRDLFRALSVGCIISDMPEIPNAKLVKSFGEIHLHKPDSPPVRYYLSGDADLLQGADKFAPKLMPNGWWDSGKVFIEGTGLSDTEWIKILELDTKGLDAATVVLTDETPVSMTFEVNPVSPTLLVVNDAYAPGWNVYIDKKKTRCLNVNLLFRGAYVPKGEHTVEFRYEPSYMAWGWLATVMGFILFIGIITVGKRRRNI